MEFPRESVGNRVVSILVPLVRYGGAAVSLAFGLCSIFEWMQIMHTDVGAFLVDQMQNGERRFNSNGDIHGDWGNQIFAILGGPAMLGMYGATLLSLFRSPR